MPSISGEEILGDDVSENGNQHHADDMSASTHSSRSAGRSAPAVGSVGGDAVQPVGVDGVMQDDLADDGVDVGSPHGNDDYGNAGSVDDRGPELTVHQYISEMPMDPSAGGYAAADLIQATQALLAHWAEPMPAGSSADTHAMGLLFVDDAAAPEGETVMARIDREVAQANVRIYTLAGHLLGADLGDAACPHVPNVSRSMRRAKARIAQVYTLLVAAVDYERSGNMGGLDDDVELYNVSDVDTLEEKDHHKYMMFALRELRARGYRRHKQNVYEQISVEWDGAVYNTHAWRPVELYDGSIESFLYRVTRKEIHPEMWKIMMTGMTVKNTTEHLALGHNSEFPDINPCRTDFAFQNGVYRASMDAFFPYGCAEFPSGVVCCKFHDNYFDTDVIFVPEWRDIPTPAFDSVIHYQGIVGDAADWMFVFMGRMQNRLRALGCDRWQIAMFICGLAGTGKSTILDMIGSWYNKDDVGIISANSEKKFGLQALLDKFILLWYEVGPGGPEQCEIQSIISGEGITIARKNKVAITKDWTEPLFMAGNGHGFTKNGSGQMDRRLLMASFDRKVVHMDPTLEGKLKSETAQLLAKCSKAYAWAVVTHGDKDIWDVIPDYYKKKREQVARELNPLAMYLHETDDIEFGDTLFMPLLSLTTMFNEYCTQRNIHRPSMASNEILHVLTSMPGRTLSLVHDQRTFANVSKTDTWVVGAGIADSVGGGDDGFAGGVF